MSNTFKLNEVKVRRQLPTYLVATRRIESRKLYKRSRDKRGD